MKDELPLKRLLGRLASSRLGRKTFWVLFLTRCFNVHEWTEILLPHVYDYEHNVGTYLSLVRMRVSVHFCMSGQKLHPQMYAIPVTTISLRLVTDNLL